MPPRRLLPLVLAPVVALTSCHFREKGEVAGKLITFNDNGAWSWFEDERVIVDAAAGKILVATVASGDGPGLAGRRGDIELVSYDMKEGKRERALIDQIGEDENNSPALLIRPDGRYVVMYSNHDYDRLTRYRVSALPHQVSEFQPKMMVDWNALGSNSNVTYNNVFYLAAEGRTYDFVRAHGRSPNILVSEDDGYTWSYSGMLTRGRGRLRAGHGNHGYFKYASNGIDRIDFIASEQHPQFVDTGIFHGYLEGGTLHRSDGTVLDADVFDAEIPNVPAFTPVFTPGLQIGSDVLSRAWPTDLQLDDEGRPYAVFTARANDDEKHKNPGDHRFLYARFDGARWVVHPIARAGGPLIKSDPDHTGLAALHPLDPGTLFISTPIDPRDGSATAHYEIYKGVTRDDGATWAWTAITTRSIVDNLRPIVPVWHSEKTALLWLRGKFTGPQAFALAVVGLIL